ncbi:hypothetical protein CG51_06515 [Haematobacter missouriensis]|uniref:Uncharacterized protein n=1 Tax=Haematobacter missouriensis TaxID=366616 RepID=A0A212AQ63_9RHOB|nr:hypothetical protein [Haematobacter missouriensis]KFI30246.1 hypothetical protein CG51_06515 [Haematobacter missouriensis]OWJ74528.1 hypothetical protein CDV53_13195 [Haematobacter missouriensis]OWJ83634.1 hypothetical protein CDV52_10480 [Haematobacter missouriensis]
MPLDMSLTAGTRVSYRVMPVADLGRSYRLWRAIRGILAEEPEFIAVAAADTAQTLDTLRAIQTLWDIPVFAAVRADAAPTEVAPLREAGIPLMGLLPAAPRAVEPPAAALPSTLLAGLDALILPAREQATLVRARQALAGRGLSLPVIAEHDFALPGERRVHRFLPLAG